MTTLIGIYLYVVAAILVVIMLRQHATGACPLLSVRNVAIVGFIVFQATSGGTALITGDYGRRSPRFPVATGLEFAAMVTVFLPLAFWSYRRGWFVRRLASKVPRTHVVPGDFGLLVLAALATVLGAFFRLGVQIPLVYKVSDFVGAGFAAMACGLVGWVWAKRFWSPGLIMYTLIILGINMLTMMQGAFGRRGLVAVAGALVWGMFYSTWRHLSLGTLIQRLALLSIGPLIFVALFTSVRASGESDRSAAEHLALMTSVGNVGDGIMKLLSGQECGPISMWLIENHPENIEYRHLMSIRFFLVFPVPREWWPDKPMPMAKEYRKLARIRRVAKNLSIGPGIIGSAGCEGGWYALIIYAILSGLFLRFFDETVAQQLHSPLIVLPIGAALGQVLALARGESSSFAAATVFTVGGTLFLTYLGYKFLASTGLMSDATYWVLEGEEGYDELLEQEADEEIDGGFDHDFSPDDDAASATFARFGDPTPPPSPPSPG